MTDSIIPSSGQDRLLDLLSQNFPSISAASTEIINLEAILNLPKGTEHFVADVHGEYEAFDHILKNASGNIKRIVTELYGNTLREDAIRSLCTLIYYPERRIRFVRESEADMDNFYHTTLHQLVRILRRVSSKYTRSKVRKTLPKEFAYIIEELLHEAPSGENKQAYYSRIVQTIISTGQAQEFIIALSNVIQRLSIDQLHILGDIYDRGPGAHIIMDTLSRYRDYDIQWGNHDALWMGAAAGNRACIANVLRISLRYANMTTLEDGYGINLVPLATFALDVYADDPCTIFEPKISADDPAHSAKSRRLIAQMHKAISIIQFKLEAEIIANHPEWHMEDRNLLHTLDFNNNTVTIEGKQYPMDDMNFPTVSAENPYKLTEEEAELTEKLVHSFMVSDKLRRHVDIMLSHGSMYKVCNSNLMFHASIPLNEDGTLKEVELFGKKYAGKELLHQVEKMMRGAFNHTLSPDQRKQAVDYYWYLWCGAESPLFDKAKMATFERYYLKDDYVRREDKGHYYRLRNQEEVCDYILDKFDVAGDHRHIINGHVPVKVGAGEKPIKANGRLMVIDGGFAKSYHRTTGIAGYTLVFHSSGFELVQHEPFTSAEDAVVKGTDIASSTQIVELNSQRLRVKDTDKGRELKAQIKELEALLAAYRSGSIKERK